MPEWSAETAFDVGVGLVLLFLGAASWKRRPSSRTGLLVVATGVAWLLGDVLPAATFLHRGPLVYLVLTYPSGRPQSRSSWAVIVVTCVTSAIYPLARSDVVTVALAIAVVAIAVFQAARPATLRPSRNRILAAALATAAALAVGPVTRFAGVDARTTVLAGYATLVLAAVTLLVVDLLLGGSAEQLVTGLVVDLGEAPDTTGLRARLARAVGDPDLVIGYWVPEEQRYVDEDGRPVAEVAATNDATTGSVSRVTTPVRTNGQPLAVLIHHPQVLADAPALADVAAAARLAVGNARLQAQVRAQVADVESSRRRLVTAADEERRRLGERLQRGARRHLATVESLLADAPEPVAKMGPDVARAGVTVRDLALGIYPAAVAGGDLQRALRSLAERSVVPVELTATGRATVPPMLAAAAYFSCAEALTNVAKYSGADAASIRLAVAGDLLSLRVTDDGRGGADPASGTGLRGLADRAEALGGSLTIDSPPGRGTTVTLQLPLAETASHRSLPFDAEPVPVSLGIRR
jgi:signal transduction histidine kinase